ncbi:hypothetical protein ACFYW8_23245 [Streptomyces sp. NPDC002742]|uniref:hypothetical protein n=1 Tax=Streptomyces sp. NPDC002742 TaxID=3364663 RepID=UPI003697EA1E
MSDPQDPQPRSVPSSAGPEEDGGEVGYAVVAEHVRRVMSWYSEQISTEMRSAVPDQQRLRQLAAERLACQDELRALDDAEPEELARIAAEYEERFTQLRRSRP